MAKNPERRSADLRRGYGGESGEEEAGSPERLWRRIRRGGGPPHLERGAEGCAGRRPRERLETMIERLGAMSERLGAMSERL